MNFWILLQKIFAVFLFILLLPFFGILGIILKVQNGGPLIFKQKRMGKDGKPFTIYKVRTMVIGAEKLKRKYTKLNEADGPVFKIYKDPRYTPIGRIVAHMAIDEFPQLINVVKGEMAIVGPRPLPWDEAQKIPQKYRKRFSVFPGITSTWIVSGGHSMSFNEWMNLDLKYVQNKTIIEDLVIILRTFWMMLKWAVKYVTVKCK